MLTRSSPLPLFHHEDLVFPLLRILANHPFSNKNTPSSPFPIVQPVHRPLLALSTSPPCPWTWWTGGEGGQRTLMVHLHQVCSIYIDLGLVIIDGQQISGDANNWTRGGTASNSQNAPLSIYVREFEDSFLVSSKEHYSRQAAGWLEREAFGDYLRRADDALTEESERVKRFLHRSTDAKLRSVLLDAMLSANTRKLLLQKPTAVNWLLENNKRDDLARCHKLFGMADPQQGLTAVAQVGPQQGLTAVAQVGRIRNYRG